MARDPVCGMTVDRKNPPDRLVYKGKEYLFCSTGCKKAFEKNPEQYLASSENISESGRGAYYSSRS